MCVAWSVGAARSHSHSGCCCSGISTAAILAKRTAPPHVAMAARDELRMSPISDSSGSHAPTEVYGTDTEASDAPTALSEGSGSHALTEQAAEEDVFTRCAAKFSQRWDYLQRREKAANLINKAFDSQSRREKAANLIKRPSSAASSSAASSSMAPPAGPAAASSSMAPPAGPASSSSTASSKLLRSSPKAPPASKAPPAGPAKRRRERRKRNTAAATALVVHNARKHCRNGLNRMGRQMATELGQWLADNK